MPAIASSSPRVSWEVHGTCICQRRRIEQDRVIPQAAVGGVIRFAGAGSACADLRPSLDESQVLLAQQIDLLLAFRMTLVEFLDFKE